jgi:hypothetical protein
MAVVEELPEAVREYQRAFETGDVSTLVQWVAADVDHLQVGDDRDPTTETAMIQGLGLAGVKAVIEGLYEIDARPLHRGVRGKRLCR